MKSRGKSRDRRRRRRKRRRGAGGDIEAPRRSLPPGSRDGIAIDTVVIVANLFVLPLVLRGIDSPFDSVRLDASVPDVAIVAFMAFAVFCRLGGLFLKRFPLQARLSGVKAGGGEHGCLSGSFFGLLGLVDLVVFMVMALCVPMLVIGILDPPGGPETPVMFAVASAAALVLAAIDIILRNRLHRPLNAAEEARRASGHWAFGRVGELAAGVGISVYLLALQTVYYLFVEVMIETRSPEELTAGSAMSFSVFLLIVFVYFYASPRSALLIEDRTRPGTWLFIGGVFLSSIVGLWRMA